MSENQQIFKILLTTEESNKFKNSKIINFNDIPGLEETNNKIYVFELEEENPNEQDTPSSK